MLENDGLHRSAKSDKKINMEITATTSIAELTTFQRNAVSVIRNDMTMIAITISALNVIT
jgi:hypothetical protein